MDVDYGRNNDRSGKPVSDFENALFILTTVMSYPVAKRAVVDAGLKALSVDSGMPRVIGYDDVSYVIASDEHGRSRSRAMRGLSSWETRSDWCPGTVIRP
jgi:3-hydroxy-D-aspartate aldolase